MTTPDRPPRCRPLPPHVVDAVAAAVPDASEVDLVERLGEALAALPAPERSAVVAAVGYAEGPVGAAIEAGVDPADGERLAARGLQLLREALTASG